MPGFTKGKGECSNFWMRKKFSGLARNTALVLAVIALAACGTDAKKLAKKDDQDRDRKENPICPEMSPYHELTLIQKQANPFKVGVDIDGQREFDECLELPKRAPLVVAERVKANKLLVKVFHQGAYLTLPQFVSVRLVNLGQCGGPETVVFTQNMIPLKFYTDYPNGKSCPGRTFAANQVEQP